MTVAGTAPAGGAESAEGGDRGEVGEEVVDAALEASAERVEWGEVEVEWGGWGWMEDR